MLITRLTLITALCLLLNVSSLYADDDSVTQLLEVTRMRVNVENALRANIEPVLTQLEQNLRSRQVSYDAERITELMGELRQKVYSEFSWTKLEPVYAGIVRKHFSPEEITSIVAFYRSPAGQALVERTPLLFQDGSTLLKPKFQKVRTELQLWLDEAVLKERLDGKKG